ncbi:MAG: hypothetical protein ACOYXB_10065 [Bacteroidota bacterium]
MESNTVSAIFSGGLADSRRLPAEKLSRVPDLIRKAVAQVNASLSAGRGIELEILQMDRFLAQTEDAGSALRMALMLLTAIRVPCVNEIDDPCSLRIALAVGPVEFRQKTLRESDGTGIRLALEAFEKMGKTQRLIIVTPDKKLNSYYRVICSFLDNLIQSWSVEQAEALYLSLEGRLQSEISRILSISQPAVNRRLKAAQWNAVEQFIRLYEQTTN